MIYCSNCIKPLKYSNSYPILCSACRFIAWRENQKEQRLAKPPEWTVKKNIQGTRQKGGKQQISRKAALYYYGEVCDLCGFKENPKLLDMHHKDSNTHNNTLNNLQILCVMCHAKITRKVIVQP